MDISGHRAQAKTHGSRPRNAIAPPGHGHGGAMATRYIKRVWNFKENRGGGRPRENPRREDGGFDMPAERNRKGGPEPAL